MTWKELREWLDARLKEDDEVETIDIASFAIEHADVHVIAEDEDGRTVDVW
jgi:hypothetical protein